MSHTTLLSRTPAPLEAVEVTGHSGHIRMEIFEVDVWVTAPEAVILESAQSSQSDAGHSFAASETNGR